MSRNADLIAIQIDRRLLENPQALHIRRVRSAVWLYLFLLARRSERADTVSLAIPDAARSMGLPDGTVCSWLGHLRKHRYVAVQQDGESILVTIRGQQPSSATPPVQNPPPPPRFFTVTKLEEALGEIGHRDGLEAALAGHDDRAIKRSLAGALAVPTAEIRRSRTALFLYLLKRHPHEDS